MSVPSLTCLRTFFESHVSHNAANVKTNMTRSRYMPTTLDKLSADCKILPCVCAALFLSANSYALELPRLVGNGMVVQRDQPIPVWGWAVAGSSIQVRFNGQAFSAETDSMGGWGVDLPKLPAGGPYTLVIEGEGKKFTFDDIWAGDVWVCSGQSNMEWPLQTTQNAENVIASANDTLIRHFKIPKSWASSRQEKLQGGEWQASSPAVAGEFTAVGYFFAQRLRSEVDVPIGLINATWGGSNIESWMDAPILGLDPAGNEKALDMLEQQEADEALQLAKGYEKWPGAIDESYEFADADWSAADLDLSDWVELEVPSLWEDEGFKGLDGVAWLRTTFSLTKEQAGHDIELGLARIDDHDVTYVNGNKVGETTIYNEIRQYRANRQLLREGINTIAIRVLDTGGGGGIWSDPGLLYARAPGLDISLAGKWQFKLDKGIVALSADRNHTPTALYNQMLHPLFKIPVKGVIWYQGESNADEAGQAYVYRDQFKAMISDWRGKWKQQELPFYWVELANYISGTDTATASPWAILRESQTDTLSLPHTGQAVIIDVGDPGDIHPRDKKTVGDRLALHALRLDYGRDDLVTDGPYALDVAVKANKVSVTFKTSSALRLRSGEALLGFELADQQGNWYPATGVLHQQSVELLSENVDRPSAVRYAWSDNPEDANLTDQSGLPANPFRRMEL